MRALGNFAKLHLRVKLKDEDIRLCVIFPLYLRFRRDLVLTSNLSENGENLFQHDLSKKNIGR